MIQILIVIGFAVILSCVVAYGSHRWDASTRTMHMRLKAAQLPITPRQYKSEEIAGLPDPVQRYFRTALKEGQSGLCW